MNAITNASVYATANGVNGVNGAGGGWGWWSWNWWWIVAAVVFVLIFSAFSWRSPSQSRKTPEEILKERFARGEITKMEFEERIKTLRNG